MVGLCSLIYNSYSVCIMANYTGKVKLVSLVGNRGISDQVLLGSYTVRMLASWAGTQP
jgi:hypothetical protein